MGSNGNRRDHREGMCGLAPRPPEIHQSQGATFVRRLDRRQAGARDAVPSRSALRVDRAAETSSRFYPPRIPHRFTPARHVEQQLFVLKFSLHMVATKPISA